MRATGLSTIQYEFSPKMLLPLVFYLIAKSELGK